MKPLIRFSRSSDGVPGWFWIKYDGDSAVIAGRFKSEAEAEKHAREYTKAVH